MKWMNSLVAAAMILAAPAALGQDAATQERLDKLSGQINDLIEVQRALQKQIAEVSRELDSLRSQVNRPNENNVTHNDLKPLIKAIEEVDRKRIDDAKAVQNQLANIARSVEAAANRKPERPPSRPITDPGSGTAPSRPERGYEYEVKSGDTLSTIVQAYREQGVKVTTEQILKANPGLKPERMKVGQTVFIPKSEK
jgi:LysM repeat protein